VESVGDVHNVMCFEKNKQSVYRGQQFCFIYTIIISVISFCG
jgi:hypothetical protein